MARQKESQSSMKDMGIKLDHKTPLLNFEQPENSIEPQEEPWTNPIEGYKWYDRSTFKKGVMEVINRGRRWSR